MAASGDRDYPIRPQPFTAVAVTDAFWRPRLETNLRVTVPYTLKRCEDTGRVANFARAAGRQEGPHEGTQFNDSDVYKVIEGASYSLLTHPDSGLEAELDRLIELIGAAQEDDGYLYTARTIAVARGTTATLSPTREGRERWSHLYMSHELYDLGHLYEAAAAHFRATGKRDLLEIALKSTALLEQVFGEDGRFAPPGHQEVEIGLVKLYRIVGDPALLALARRFLAARGHHDGREPYGEYAQDHLPVAQQSAAVGHAVRAGYMYSAVADVVALGGEPAWGAALDRIWQDVVGSKLYLTGGIGARHEGEAFGDPFELPNATAYAETCAAIANMMWNHRMFLLHGDARYLDVLERTLYNGFLSGVSLEGERFFYPNPLASDGAYAFNVGEGATRSPWFDVSCCPTNVVRAMPSLPGYVYAQADDDVYLNLYLGNRTRLEVNGVGVALEQATDYPWSGDVRLTVEPERPVDFALRLRIPGWSLGRPVPGGLYRYAGADAAEGGHAGAAAGDAARADASGGVDAERTDPSGGADAEGVELRVNGAPAELRLERGFAVLRRTWRPGDLVELHLPMPVRRVLADARVEDDRGRVAVERGPLVYCAEGVDHGGRALDLSLDDAAPLAARHRPELLGGVTVLEAQGLTLIPYYAWSHRGVGEMAVWLRRALAPRQAEARAPSSRGRVQG